MTTVTNRKSTFDANTNADYNVKTTVDGGELVQHVNIDSIPAVTVTGVATEATLSGIATSASNINTILSNANESGFFSRLLILVGFILEYLRALPFVVPTALGVKVQALVSTDSSLNSVSTVSAVTTVSTVTNVTNMNTIDSREIIWSMWLNGYNEGVRSKIV